MASPPELGPAVPRGRAERVKSLDGIRAISILAVFGYHALVLHMRGGWLGVETFFVLSGYLITSVLLAEYLRTGDLSLSRFWRRRVRRLWPALMVMVIVVAPAYRAGPFAWHSFGAYAVSAMQAVLYVSDLGLAYFGGSAGFIGHTWTLGVEMYFYVLWPLLLLWLLRSRRQLLVPTLLGLCVTSIVATTTNLATDPGAQLGYYAPYTQALPLLVGSLLAVLQHDGTLPKLSPKSGSLLAAVGMSGLISLILLSKMVEGTNFFTPLLLATASTGILLFGLEAAPSSPVARLLSVRPLATLGLISYSFYLYQSPIIFAIGYGIRGDLRVPCLLVLTIGCSTLSYLYVERQFRSYGAGDNRARARQPISQRRSRLLPAVDAVAAASIDERGD